LYLIIFIAGYLLTVIPIRNKFPENIKISGGVELAGDTALLRGETKFCKEEKAFVQTID